MIKVGVSEASVTAVDSGRTAPGAGGGNAARRLYRRSPLRALKVRFEHRGISADDVFLASYPRSGNAWLRFMALEMLGRGSGFDAINDAMPYVGRHLPAPPLAFTGGRFIKTHEPYLPVYCRAIYVARDPRDVAVSYFRFLQRVRRLRVGPGDDVAATFDRYLDAFLAGHVDGYGTWQNHVLSWRAAAERGSVDILRLRYEDMRARPVDAVRQIAAWLSVDLSDDAAELVAERCSFERMRDAEQQVDPRVFGSVEPTISYMGSGSLGGWRDALTRHQQRRFVVFADGMAALGYDATV